MKKDIQFTIPKQATEPPIIDLLNHLGEDYLKYNSRFESISTWLV